MSFCFQCLGKRASSPEVEKLPSNKIGVLTPEEKEEANELKKSKSEENNNNYNQRNGGPPLPPKPSSLTSPASNTSSPALKKRPLHGSSGHLGSNYGSRPALAEFLVSFLVDARGGAMKGCRGSGLRIIIPPGAVQSPVRVTCRYVRHANRLLFPPPLMEREALASRVVEVGPAGATFLSPVLLEVPHFASLREDERELVVLRSDDGETWREHTTVFIDNNDWRGGKDDEEEIYEDIATSTGMNPVCDELDTKRIVRISMKVLPKYFALLFRVREQVRGIGLDGGEVGVRTNLGFITAKFNKGAVQKRIKVALQGQIVPSSIYEPLFPDGDVVVSPLIAIEPRRRRFHESVQLSVPLPRPKNKICGKKVHLLCSLAGNTANANWEDLSTTASFIHKDNHVLFQTRVSALFWIFVSDYSPKNPEGMKSEEILEKASCLYERVLRPPYMARFVIFYRPRFPHAWCDSLLAFCVTDDKADRIFDKDPEWKMVGQSEEVEIPHKTGLTMSIESAENIQMAKDCQIDSGLIFSEFTFKAFDENSFTLLLKNSYQPSASRTGKLVFSKKHQIRKGLEYPTTSKTTTPYAIVDIDLSAKKCDPAKLIYAVPCKVPNSQKANNPTPEYPSFVAHRVLMYNFI
ncbi:ankyrin-3 isoform X3 [Lepeophtheirus salmonis]|nr:ankyrin-3-like isoform X3 [Lepeophtheirus salmonis]XP_040583620.1 ankyrin-3-like isoform X3 [Lepeophtheirus salmonis]XP_040583621.1 ankyrin-3-like isoform X3 [Lepeophtheirus salmonis]